MSLRSLVSRILPFLASAPAALEHENILRSMLSDGRFEWRKLSTLAAAIGKSEAETAIALRRLGAIAGNKFGEVEKTLYRIVR